mmetsp:Transcript_34004/g.67603  ORF Transcript_34004/g.67603 Transcript_34004/m.67603 type:complete len:425 (-) Transcript_34004:37-1311(-)
MASYFPSDFPPTRRTTAHKTYCRVCDDTYPETPEDEECPVCGAPLEVAPISAVYAALPETQGVQQGQLSANLLAEQQQFLTEQVGDGRTGEEIALAMSMQVGDTSSKAASSDAIRALQRFIVEDGRCSALHEVVLELLPTRVVTGQPPSKRVFFETQIAAFSELPPAEDQGDGGVGHSLPICFGDPTEGNRPFNNGDAMKGAAVVLKRGGGATFAAKALRAQAAGAAAVVIEQTADVWPFTMKDSAGECQNAPRGSGLLTIPAVMLRSEDAAKLRLLVEERVRASPREVVKSADGSKGSGSNGGLGEGHSQNSTRENTARAGREEIKSCARLTSIPRVAFRVQPLDAHCPVCQDAYASQLGAVVCRLPCRHLFHETCVLTWLGKRNTCPICRFELPAADEAYEASRFERQRENTRDAAFLSWFS